MLMHFKIACGDPGKLETPGIKAVMWDSGALEEVLVFRELELFQED